MKVNKEQLVKLIELVVKKEVKSAVNEAVKNSIMDALQETANSGEWKSMGGDEPYDSSRMGEVLNKQYQGMDSQSAPVDIAADTAAKENKPVAGIPDTLRKALNKNYSELVKRF